MERLEVDILNLKKDFDSLTIRLDELKKDLHIVKALEKSIHELTFEIKNMANVNENKDERIKISLKEEFDTKAQALKDDMNEIKNDVKDLNKFKTTVYWAGGVFFIQLVSLIFYFLKNIIA